MKKILAMTLAIFLLCVAQVSAKEYYCGKSSDGFKVYFLSESAARYDSNPPKFTCNTRCEKNGQSMYLQWYFKAAGGWRYAFSENAPDSQWKLADSDKLAHNVMSCTTNMIYIGEVMPNSYISE